MEKVKVAVFPIPGMVSFPTTTVPLHVFEPRYRSMIKDCVKNKIKIGVCHTEEMISKGPKNQDKAKLLNSNQSTFKPQEIFSAGLCTIDEVTPDGRFRVSVNMDARYKLDEKIQEIPYTTYYCTEYSDESDSEEKTNAVLREAIDTFLFKYSEEYDDKEFYKYIQSSKWKDLSNIDYSFKIFEKIKLEPYLAQVALESKSLNDRLKIMADALDLKY